MATIILICIKIREHIFFVSPGQIRLDGISIVIINQGKLELVGIFIANIYMSIDRLLPGTWDQSNFVHDAAVQTVV